MKFKTTAEAAEKLHTSVDNVEVAMSKLEEHGFEFDGIEKSGKLLNDYKDNLDGLKTIYDSLNEGDDKDRIGKLIEGYDSEYEKFQDDMSGLSEDQVVKIKFEYWHLPAFFIDSQDPSTSGSRPQFASTLCFTLTMASAIKNQ